MCVASGRFRVNAPLIQASSVASVVELVGVLGGSAGWGGWLGGTVGQHRTHRTYRTARAVVCRERENRCVRKCPRVSGDTLGHLDTPRTSSLSEGVSGVSECVRPVSG